MPTNTYTPLANITLSSSASSVTFSSISQAYRDLIVVVQGLTTSGQNSVFMRFNSDTGNNYNMVYMQGNGSTTASGSFTDSGVNLGVVDSSSMSQMTFQVMDYSATDKHKTALVRTDIAGWGTRAGAGRWANTAAVSTAAVVCIGSTFTAGTTVSLFGVAA